jgi:hypothetical protein
MATTLSARLVKALGDIDNPTLDAKNPHFNSRYATLASHVAVAREAMKRHGIAVMQPITDGEGGKLTIRTILLDESGDRMEFPLSFNPPGDPQKVGSAITYFRRYSLASALGIVGEEDDDANAATGGDSRPDPRSPAAKPKRPEPKRPSEPDPFVSPAPEPPVEKDSLKEFTDSRSRVDPVAKPKPAHETATAEQVERLAIVADSKPDPDSWVRQVLAFASKHAGVEVKSIAEMPKAVADKILAKIEEKG